MVDNINQDKQKPQISQKELCNLILYRYHAKTERKMRLETYEQIEDITDVMIKAVPGLLRPSQIGDKVRWRFWFIRNKNPENIVLMRLSLLKKLNVVIKKEDRGKMFYELLYDIIPKRQETEIIKRLPSVFRKVIEYQTDYEDLRNDLLHSESHRTTLSVIDALHDLKKAILGIKLNIREYDLEKQLLVIKKIELLLRIYQAYYKNKKFQSEEEQAAYLKLVESLRMFYNIKPKGW
jgi:hypothetical protein